MRFCACGKGCSDVLALIRCVSFCSTQVLFQNNTYRSLKNEKANLSQVSFAADKPISSCLDDNAIKCDPLLILNLGTNSQSVAECSIPVDSISNADGERRLLVKQNASFAEESDCVPALCLSSTKAPTAATQKKTPCDCASPRCSGFRSLSSRVMPPADAELISLTTPAYSEGIGSGVQNCNESICFGNRVPDCMANSVDPAASPRLSGINFSDSRPRYSESESSSGSEALEDLLTRLRTDGPTKQVRSEGHSDLLFVVSDSSPSPDLELNNDPSFYHRIENAHLKKSTK